MRQNLKFHFGLDLKWAMFFNFFSQIPKLLKNYNFTSQITKHAHVLASCEPAISRWSRSLSLDWHVCRLSRWSRTSFHKVVTFVVSRHDHVRRFKDDISIILGTVGSWDWYFFLLFFSFFFTGMYYTF